MRKSAQLIEQSVLERDYGASMRSNVRAFWAGDISLDEFFYRMSSTIERGLTRAWFDGAAKCGISPDELTTKETDALRRLIQSEKSYIFNFAIAIENGSKSKGGKLSPFIQRAGMWSSRAVTAFNLGESYACEDKKKIWVMGDAEHCNDCPKLHGKVKRYSWWREHNLIPPTPGQNTECEGWKCKCRLKDTNLPLSKGRMPTTGKVKTPRIGFNLNSIIPQTTVPNNRPTVRPTIGTSSATSAASQSADALRNLAAALSTAQAAQAQTNQGETQ